MVTVTGFKIAENEDGDTYVRLQLSGSLEMVQSKETGNFYATVRKCSIPCTFSEEVAQTMIGSQMTGSITKQEVDEYDYTLESGETITLTHRWVYTQSESDTAIRELVNHVETEQLEVAA